MRIPPPSLTRIKESLATVCGREIARRDLKPRQLAKLYGCTARRAQEVISSVKGGGPDVGMEVLIRLADCLNVPCRLSVGAEARSLPQITPPSLLPTISSLARRVAA